MEIIDIRLSELPPNLNPEQTNIIESVIEQIQMLLFTRPGDVLGDPEFGIDLNQFIFELSFSNYEITRVIKNQISRYVLWEKYFNIDVSVRLIKGEFQDSAFIDILIDGIPTIGVHIK